MAKRKSTLGKFIAFTTTVAAIGGICYVYRDKIKESSVYQKSKDTLSNLRSKVSDKLADEDDFCFDDDFEDDFEDDVFSEDAKKSREYTSITINAKDSTPVSTDKVTQADDTASDDDNTTCDVDDTTSNEDDTADTEETTVVSDKPVDDMKEIFADTVIPTITFGAKNNTAAKDETSATTEEVEGYENEGLSDIYEDPDVLESQDRLDF